jgi:hypothetical protein
MGGVKDGDGRGKRWGWEGIDSRVERQEGEKKSCDSSLMN